MRAWRNEFAVMGWEPWLDFDPVAQASRVTAPTIVIPYWLWARRVLRQHDVPEHDPKSTAIAIAAAPLMFAIRALTHVILGRREELLMGVDVGMRVGEVTWSREDLHTR